MRRNDTVIFHLALLSCIAITVIQMLILEAEGKSVRHKPIGHPKTRHFINRNKRSFNALDSPKLHKRSPLKKHPVNSKHFSKDEVRRALDVDIDVKQSRAKGSHHHGGGHHDESEKKMVGLFDGPPFMRKDNQTCEECIQEQQDIFKELSEKILRNEEQAKSGVVKPAYKCDEWDVKSRTCWLNRNIGDTVTFILSFNSKLKRIPKVIWKQEFHERGKEERKHFVLQRENPTWNIVIGSKGHEMRVSPISEIDVDPNLFSTGLAGEEDDESTSALFFRIRLIPNDLGFVYPGETLVLNMASYISLPLENMHYVWYMEKDSEFDALPSNMKGSPSGSVLTISELRKEQEGVMTCAVYSNLGILVAKKRFLIKEISSNDILMNPTNRSYPFEEKRNSQHSIIKRRKPEEKIEKSLRQLESEKSGLATNKEGFDVDYNMDKEELPFIDELLESPSDDDRKPGDLFNTAGYKSNPKSLKLPPPASAVKMDAIQQERKSRQNSPEFSHVAQQQQYQQPAPQYQQQQGSQYQQQQDPQYQQQQGAQYQQQQDPQYQQQQPQYQQQQPQYQQQQPQYQQQQPQYQQQPENQQRYEPQLVQQQPLQYGQQQPQYEQNPQQYDPQLQQQQYEQVQQQYEQQRLQHEQQQRLQQERYEQQRLQHEQYEQQRLQQEQQQRLQQEQQQRLQQEQQQRLHQEQQQRLQQEQQQRLQLEQQRLQQEQQQRLQQEQQRLQQQRLQQKQLQQQRLQQEQLKRLQKQRLQQEQQKRLQQEQQKRLQQERQRLQQEQQLRLQKEQQQGLLQKQKEQQQSHQQQESVYPGEGRELSMEQDVPSEPSEFSADQNLSPSLAKYSMGQIHQPKENDNLKSEGFLSRQRHSTELISPIEQMPDTSGQDSPYNQKANSGRLPNLPEDISDNSRGLGMPPQNFPPDNRQYPGKKTSSNNQKEYSAQNFPANQREHFKQSNVPPVENEFWSPEIFIENRETRPEDEISKIISRCQNDRECAGSAMCNKGQAAGFCRCLPNFHGNGISCWEDMIPRNARQFSNVQIQDRTNTGQERKF